MNVEIGAEAALFPEKEYINGIAVAVQGHTRKLRKSDTLLKGEGGMRGCLIRRRESLVLYDILNTL